VRKRLSGKDKSKNGSKRKIGYPRPSIVRPSKKGGVGDKAKKTQRFKFNKGLVV